ncbi:hypothetical protein BH10PSE17_BH10PSE17_26380 [soil metagenome]
MIKPPTFAETMFGAMGLPGFGSPAATLDPMKGFAVPTVDVEELDRRITDLRSVEGWLQTQATMVRTTIQALEVQRNTVMMVKSFGANLPQGSAFPGAAFFAQPGAVPEPVSPEPPEPPAPKTAAPRTPRSKADPLAAAAGDAAINNATAWWGLLQDQFSKMTGVTAPASSAPKAKARKSAKPTGAKRKPSRSPG